MYAGGWFSLSITSFDGLTIVSSDDPWATAKDILVFMLFTTARWTTLLYFPLLIIFTKQSDFISITRKIKLCKSKHCYNKLTHLNMIASVDQKWVGRGIDINPVAIMLQLETTIFILYKDGEEAMVRMRGHAHCKIRPWTWRIQVCYQDLETWIQT